MQIENIKQIIKHSFVYGIGSIAQSALGLLLLPILTGHFSEKEFGIYSLIQLFSTIASAIFYLGMTSAFPRSYYDYSNEREKKEVFTTTFIITATGAITQSFLGLIFGAILSKSLFGNSLYESSISCSLFAGSLFFINQLYFTYLRMMRKSVESVVLGLISLCSGISLTVWKINTESFSIDLPFEALACSQIITLLLFIVFYGKNSFTFSINKKEIYTLLKFGIASIFASFAGMIIESSDKFLIQKFDNLNDLGLYSALSRVAAIIVVIYVSPFIQIWNPMMLEFRKKSDIKNLFTKVFKLYFVFGGVILLLVVSFSSQILGKLIKFSITDETRFLFFILLVSNLIYGSTNIVVAGFFYRRRIFKLAIIYYAIAAIKILLNIFAIKNYGIVGATFINLLISFIAPAILYYYSSNYFSFKYDWFRLSYTGCITLFFIFCIQLIELRLDTSYVFFADIVMLVLFASSIVKFSLDDKERHVIFNYLKLNFKKQH